MLISTLSEGDFFYFEERIHQIIDVGFIEHYISAYDFIHMKCVKLPYSELVKESKITRETFQIAFLKR